jgi:EAL domain-containing protein (putative c-di-GMP-specific phosphodiesterase class I)
MCLRSGRVSGLEALLRWRHPEQGVVLPSAFLADAEESGLINQIGEQVLDQAARFIAALKASGIAPLPLSVNVSYREYSAPQFVQRIAEVLSRHGLEPQHLTIELREDGLNGNQHVGLDVLSQLRDLGVRRALDGFGDTMSDLNYLKQLPLTDVQMPAVAVRTISTEPNSGAMAKSLIDIGHNLGLHVMANDVETRFQLDYLQQHGCDEMQGWRRRRRPERANLAFAIDPVDQGTKDLFGHFIRYLAGAGVFMPAAAILEHQGANIGVRGAVQDRFSGRKDRILILQAPQNVD